MEMFMEQYQLVKQTREVLFSYCESLPHADYARRLDSFAKASMRDLHRHVAECYTIWLGKRALRLEEVSVQVPHGANVADIRQVFTEVDAIVERFLVEFGGTWNTPLDIEVSWQQGTISVTPLWLFTHTVTHEFHHKGQMVSISRHLGHIPPDTDLVV